MKSGEGAKKEKKILGVGCRGGGGGWRGVVGGGGELKRRKAFWYFFLQKLVPVFWILVYPMIVSL